MRPTPAARTPPRALAPDGRCAASSHRKVVQRNSERVVLRADARFDDASRALFVKEGGLQRRQQTTVASNVMLLY